MKFPNTHANFLRRKWTFAIGSQEERDSSPKAEGKPEDALISKPDQEHLLEPATVSALRLSVGKNKR